MISKDFLFEPNMQYTCCSIVEITYPSRFQLFPSLGKAAENHELLMETC